MNTNIDNINEFITKTFNSQTRKKESFIIKLKYKEYKLTISFLENNYILFTCSTNSEFYFASIHEKDLYKSLLNINNINITNSQNDFISLINTNILSIKEFLNLNIILIYLTSKKNNATILEFFMKKINEKNMNNEVIKMLFKKRDEKQDDEYNKIINSNSNSLEVFNKMYGLSLKGNKVIIDLTFNKRSSKYSPLLKISPKGFLLFCKSNFTNINKLILKNNDINELNVFENLNMKNLKHWDLGQNNIFDISPLTRLNLPKLEKLVLSRNQIQDITCLKNIKAPSLKELDLSYNFIEDINSLENSSWPLLKSFDLSYNQIKSIILFKKASFPSLEYLNLNTNKIFNMHPLSKALKKISILILNQNKFEKLDFLKQCNFNYLKEIYLYSCDIKNITGLSNAQFPNLQTLSLPENKISDLYPLISCNFPKLKKLSLYGNNIQDISHLQHVNFPELTELFLYQNKIKEINCINLFNFSKLSTLSLMSNQIKDISVFKYTQFNYCLETLALSKNKIKDISIFSAYSTTAFNRLKELWLDYNEINNIDKLDKAKITFITKIKLGHNFIQNITVIQRMAFYYLKEIDLNNNVISDINCLIYIRKKSLKSINLSNNSFVVGDNSYTLNFLKDQGIQVLL